MLLLGSRPLPLLCVHCGAVLPAPSAERLGCAACGQSYPVVASGIPVLLLNAEDHCLMSVAELLGDLQYLEAVIDHQEGRLAAGCRRPAAVRRLLDGMRSSAAVARRLLGLLPTRWPLEQLMAQRPHTPFARESRQYLVRDWGGRPGTEAATAEILGAIRRQLGPAQGDERGRALVLGAGTGRYAWELTADFADVVALDWSVAAVLSYALLVEGPLDLHELNQQNVATVEDIAVPTRCAIPAAAASDGERGARLRWLIADGRNVPLASGSCAAVLSVYFSDLVPAAALVDEAWRLLRPGGRFVHFGPLGYEHTNFDEMPTAEELCAQFAERGFRISPCEWVPHLYWSSQRLVQPHMNAFAFAAVKPDS